MAEVLNNGVVEGSTIIYDQVKDWNNPKSNYPDVHWTTGAGLVPSPLYQVYRILTNWAGTDDESLYSKFNLGADKDGNVYHSKVEFIAPSVEVPVAADPSNPTDEEKAAIEEAEAKNAELAAAFAELALGNVKANQYGYAFNVITVKITPNEELAKIYKNATVSIDGKEHNLAWLENPIKFDMSVRDHRVEITWDPLQGGKSIESIRIVANR